MGYESRSAISSRKKAISLFVVFAACIALACGLLVGCGTSSGSSGNAGKITDAYGRTVELPKEVKSVATVGSGARIVVYAGGVDKLIAVTEMETNAAPVRPYTIVYADTFSQLPTTSNGNHLMETSVDVEKMVELAPDVIISSRSAEECNQLQEATKIPVVGVSYQDEVFGDDLMKSIEIVGTVLGTSDHAKSVVAKIKGWKDELAKLTSGIKDDQKPSVYVGSVNYKGAKGFTGTYGKFSVFTANGIKNVADEKGVTGWFETDLEQIGAWNPDYIFLNPANKTLLNEEYANNTAFFDGLKAIQGNQVFTLPAFNMNGTNAELGICASYFTGATVYPEQFKSIDLAKKYDEILETMLGKACYEQLSQKGIVYGPMKLGE